MARFKVGSNWLELLTGDITKQDTEAIVNAANTRLAGGGGVDGAIHRAGGPAIMKECDKIRKEQGGCPTGRAVITTGGNLKARYVIHTVGPIWYGGHHDESELLASAYRSSMQLAKEKGIRSIAFPSISTGTYGYPLEQAAGIALNTIIKFLLENDFGEVRVVLFSKSDFRVYLKVCQEIIKR
ncbi:O-acetyl-ADP-ribose deacetylase [Desulfolucanica intricata]|uniref:O-acetyl-ADP-ribose deacetylase n=1 Tax=Desulfolucanica intricata TaxID=1285191 RepID=UPI0008321F36|nr:O-acetyl-ADP-ribose deacetylase [Desulfolucanica intricata]